MDEILKNAQLFNQLKETYNQLRYKDVENLPCCIFVEYYKRKESGSLNDIPVYNTSVLEHVSDLKFLKMDSDDAYIIQAIVILPNIMHVPEFVKLQDFKNFGTKIGLYLDMNDRLGQEIKNKYDHYSYSWFDDYDSN
jgi:hypothetical protein